MAYDNIKSDKKPEIHYLFSRYIFQKNTEEVKLSPSLFMIKNIYMSLWLISTRDLQTVYICKV